MTQELQKTSSGTPEEKIYSEEIVIWDKDNPRALVNLVPDVINQRMQEALKKSPDLFEMDEKKLRDVLRKREENITPTDNRIRIKFWVEYDRVISKGFGVMSISQILANICSREFFYAHYLTKPSKVAWMLCSPSDYGTKASEALDFGLDQLRDILEIPHIENGKVDMKLVSAKLKVVAMLADRVRGGVVQKVVSLNATTSDTAAVNRIAMAMTSEELERKMLELEDRNRRALHLPLEPRAKEPLTLEVEPQKHEPI